VGRVRNQYLMELMIKLPRDKQMLQHCKLEIQQQTAILHNDKKFRSVTIVPDIDPI
jgi:primosomal protein N' (replication factor Y)